MFVCECVHFVHACDMPTYVWVPEEARTFDAMELELQAVMSPVMWVLGTELGFLAKAVFAFNQ